MEQLGIESGLLLAQVINFLIIVFVLSRLLYKPILTMLEKRKREIEDGLALTEKMRQEEENLQQKKAKLLDTARKEAQMIIAEARKQAMLAGNDALANAQKESLEIIDKGKTEVERLKKSMEKEIRASAVNLAATMAKRLLSGVLTPVDKHKILQQHLKELESIRP